MPSKRLYPDQIAEALEMRAQGKSWDCLSDYFGVSADVIQGQIVPGFRELRRQQARALRRRQQAARERARNKLETRRTFEKVNPYFEPRIPAHEFRPKYDPHRDGYLPYESISAIILGDPPIGRRAIDMRRI